jgi:hypothetical protein
MRPFISVIVLVLTGGVIHAAPGAAPAPAPAPPPAAPAVPPPTSPIGDASFTAFDLAAGVIATDQIPSGATPGSYTQGLCTAGINGSALELKRTAAASCTAIFDATQPAELFLDLDLPAPPPPPKPPKGKCPACPVLPAAPPSTRVSLPLAFDRGIGGVFAAVVDVPKQQIDLQNAGLDGDLVYHSDKTHTWTTIDVSAGKAALQATGEGVTADTRMYLRLRYTHGGVVRRDDDLFEVRWAPPAAAAAAATDTTCDQAFERAKRYDWAAFVDAKPTTGELEVVHHPRRLATNATDPFKTPDLDAGSKGAIIDPHAFGLVVVRHPAGTAMTFNSGVIALTMPSFFTGPGQDGASQDPARVAPVPTVAEPLVCSYHQVGPHAPGQFKVTVALNKASGTTSSKISDVNLDLVVVKRYLGAFRVGVAGIVDAPDRKFEARTAPGSSQAEIVRTEHYPVELVLGYSVYLETLYDDRARSYFDSSGRAKQDGRFGLFLGFGVASYSETNINYLQSLHLGLEYELGPHLAIAVTGVARRVEELAAGAMVGAPTAGNPATVPTQKDYDLGGAIVINISPSFFKFPRTITQ